MIRDHADLRSLMLELRNIRIDKGYSYRALAELCGIDAANLAHYESLRVKVGIKAIQAIANALGLSIRTTYTMTRSQIHIVNKATKAEDE